MTRVALVHLTPEQLELLSAMAERPDFEVVGAVHADADSTPYKIAQLLAIPTHTAAESLRGRAPDLVVVPEEPAEVRREVEALGLEAEVLTTREAATRFGLAVDFGLPDGPVLAAASPWSHLPPAGAAASPRPGGGLPNLEIMLRDGLDELLVGEGDLSERIGRLAEAWAELLGAEACALWLEDPGRVGDVGWVAGGPRAGLARGPDALVRAALEAGVPQMYVRHEPPPGSGEEAPAHPRRALAAFPLEAVRGVLWLLDLRLPAHEVEERLMVLRRIARRLGRLLALEGRVARLLHERAAATRVADLVARMAAATGYEEVAESLREAIVAELRPELAVFRLPGPGGVEPEVVNALPPALGGQLGLLLAAEEELARSARAALRTQQQPPMGVGDRMVAGFAVPIRRGNEVLGTVAVFRSGPASEADSGNLWSEDERRLVERLTLHAAGALALAAAARTEPAGGDATLDRRALAALLRAEVKRSERYSVPFLLTVFELEATGASAELGEELVGAFQRRLRARLRESDALARLGPWRFAVLNPHTDRTGGRVVVRARQILEELEAELPGAGAIDVRANQIHFPADVTSLDELLARLDQSRPRYEPPGGSPPPSPSR